ncbi:MAG TPA: TonB-dependent receptor [Vicinamibacterales bacterium]|nr:TonB-dependent receptor [Vicinamibacterales bacterium]
MAIPIANAAAQVSTFDLSGTVRDAQGGVLPGVTVSVRNEETGVSRVVVSDEAGSYYFAALPPQGSWALSFDLAGFSPQRRTGLKFAANTKPVINATLTVGALEETVTVVGDRVLLDTGQAMLALRVSEEQIQELPLIGRDFLDLALMGSGVTEVATGAVAGAQSQTISGTYSRYTSYQLDGFNNTRDQHGVQKADVSLDAISEFSVLTNQFSAEYGQSMSGIVSVITKSGTNDLKGSAFLYVRPGDWDANDRLTGRTAPYNRQDTGFTFGGPLKRDRTHFFTSFEYRNEDEQAVVTATLDGGRYQGTFPVGSERLRFMSKLNHRFNDRNLFDVSFIVGDETGRSGIGGFTVADNPAVAINDDLTVQGTYTRLMSDRAVNEVKISYSTEEYSSIRQATTLTDTGVGLNYPGQGNLPGYSAQTAPDSMLQLANKLTWNANRHVMKVGVSAHSATPGGLIHSNIDGTYGFSPGAPFPYDPNTPGSWPVSFSQGFFGPGGGGELQLDEWHVALFAQDDWKPRSDLTLNLGVRYQYESSVPDYNNIAPRIGLAWDPAGDGRMVVRGGFGIFHSAVFSTIDAFEAFSNVNGFRSVTFVPGDALFPQFPNKLPGPTLPAGVTPPPGPAYLEAAEYAPSVRKHPESHNYTIGFERELWRNFSASVDFSYNRGRNVIVPTDLNAPPFFDYTTGARRSAQVGDALRPLGVPGRPIPPGAFDVLPNGYPFGGFRQLWLLESSGWSDYRALRFELDRRFVGGFSVQAQYTWSRLRNVGDDFRFGNSLPLNPDDREMEEGRGATDIPHQFSLNGIVRLPWDLQLSGIVRARSGAVVDPRIGQDINGDRNTRERPVIDGRIAERNSFRRPGTVVADMSFVKRVRLGGTTLEGRFEVFNLTNRLNVSGVNGVWGLGSSPLPSFMQITSTAPPRRFQVAGRVTF